MATATVKTDWLEANLACLDEEFARLRNRLSAKEGPRPLIDSERASLDPPPVIDRLSEIFGLSRFERELLLLCAGVEMDSKLAAQCAEAQGHPQQTYVTFGLAMAVLSDPHWSALTPARPLRRFRLLEVDTSRGLASAPVRIDERILHYLAGMNLLDQRLESFLRIAPCPDWIAEEHRAIAAQAMRIMASYSQYSPVVHLCGDDPQGQEDVAALTAQEAGRPLLLLRVEDLPPVGARAGSARAALGAGIAAAAGRVAVAVCRAWADPAGKATDRPADGIRLREQSRTAATGSALPPRRCQQARSRRTEAPLAESAGPGRSEL